MPAPLKPREFKLENGQVLIIRRAEVADAPALIDHARLASGESDFLSFGPGEFELTEPEEEEFIRKCLNLENHLFLIGTMGGAMVAVLTFSGGLRPRLRHAGEFGMSVRRSCWGLGIGSLMLDALIDWARATRVVKKINLRVRTDNRRAILLYERKGFVREGTISREMFLGGEYFDHHWMGLEL